MSFPCRHARAAQASFAIALLLGFVACTAFDESLLRPLPATRGDAATPHPEDGGSDGGGQAGAAGAAGNDAGESRDGDGAGSGGQAGAAGSDAGPTCNTTSAGDSCAGIPGLGGDPVIDGELDCAAPQPLELPKVGWNGAQPAPEQHRTQLSVATTSSGLYVHLEVRGGEPPRPHPAGSSIDCGDAVEIYVDADGILDEQGTYGSPGTMQFIVAAPNPAAPATIEALRFIGGENQGPWLSDRIRTAVLEDGYAVELFVGAADLNLTAWAPSGRIGFDVAIDVAAAPDTPDLRCGAQLGQYFLRVGPDEEVDGGICHGKPWCDTRAFCTPEI